VEHPQIHWFADPAILAPLALIVFIYVRRFREARRESGGRGATWAHALAFTGSMLALLAALVTPIDGLGEEYLFSAHMFQHVLLGDIAPLLFLLSLSRVILRPVTRRLMGVERALGPLASPITAIVIWLGTMYLWHIPALYDAALEHPTVHALEHTFFMTAGVLYWWHLMSPIRSRTRLTGMGPIVYMLSTKLLVGILGIAITFAPDALYAFYKDQPPIWGLDPGDDQALAGAIMALEQSIVMGIALAYLFVRALEESNRQNEREERYELDAVEEVEA
jgi:cytochrome c oxidase assembly factor CtaG